MLRRDFLRAITAFTAATAAVKAGLVAAGTPPEKADAAAAKVFCGCSPDPLPLPLDPVTAEAVEQRDTFERTLVSLMRDHKSLRVLGVTSHRFLGGFEAMLMTSPGTESPVDRRRLDGLLDRCDSGLLHIKRVEIMGDWDGISVSFDVCTPVEVN